MAFLHGLVSEELQQDELDYYRSRRAVTLDSQATVDQFASLVQRLMGQLPSLVSGRELQALGQRLKAQLD